MVQQYGDFRSEFDAGQYIDLNYGGEMIPEDEQVLSFAANRLAHLPSNLERVIDVGSGGSLIGLGLMAPLVADNGVLVAYDIGTSQLRELEEALEEGRQGNLGEWEKYQELIAKYAGSRWQGSFKKACLLTRAERRSIDDLKVNEADGGTLFYVVESSTDSPEVFRERCDRFFRAVKMGGPLVWAAMIGSTGYDSPGKLFPATPISLADMHDIMETYCDNTQIMYTSSSGHARDPGSSTGYRGMAVGVGIKDF